MFKKKMSVKRDQSADDHLPTITVEIGIDSETVYNDAVKIISETCCESQEYCIDCCAPYRINCTPSSLLEGDPRRNRAGFIRRVSRTGKFKQR